MLVLALVVLRELLALAKLSGTAWVTRQEMEMGMGMRLETGLGMLYGTEFESDLSLAWFGRAMLAAVAGGYYPLGLQIPELKHHRLN